MQSGLDGVVAAETVLSHANRERGMFWVRGVALPDLVASHGYEGTIALLGEGFAGEGLARDGVCGALGAARETAFAGLSHWLETPARGLETRQIRGKSTGASVTPWPIPTAEG